MSEYFFVEVMDRMKMAVKSRSYNSLAASLGMSSGDFANRKKRNAVPYDAVFKLAHSHNVSVDWLLSGEGPMFRDEKSEGSVIAVQHPGDAPMENSRVWIPWLDMAASAGAGMVVYQEDRKGWIGFDPVWLWENYKLRSHELAVMSVSGQSMEPTLRNGELILFSIIKDNEFKEGIHVIRFDGCLMVKHVQRVSSRKVRLVSEHPSYEPVEIDLRDESLDFVVLGRVVLAFKMV